MEAVSFQIPKTEKESYRVQIDEVSYFYDLFHFHQEFQITLIQKGYGTCIIGDYISTFKPGDLFVIGQNLPHVFRSDKSFYDNEEQNCLSTSLLLSPSFIQNPFFELDELSKFNIFFQNAKRGIRYSTKNKSKLVELFLDIKPNKRERGIISVFEFISKLSNKQNAQYLSHVDYKQISKEVDGVILNTIFQFTLSNYKNDIHLETVAKMANMSPPAFCRFFKKRTRKTYISFLNEVRIQEACSQILKGDSTISEICFNSGFNTITNFNRQFKKITGFTPKEYRNK